MVKFFQGQRNWFPGTTSKGHTISTHSDSVAIPKVLTFKTVEIFFKKLVVVDTRCVIIIYWGRFNQNIAEKKRRFSALLIFKKSSYEKIFMFSNINLVGENII